jgi:excisionase family DNA binding protein
MNAAIELPDTVIDEIAKRAIALLADVVHAKSEPWLNVEQAAAHLGISVSQIYTLCSQRHRNGIPMTKEGSRSYFKASELDAWRTRGER